MEGDDSKRGLRRKGCLWDEVEELMKDIVEQMNIFYLVVNLICNKIAWNFRNYIHCPLGNFSLRFAKSKEKFSGFLYLKSKVKWVFDIFNSYNQFFRTHRRLFTNVLKIMKIYLKTEIFRWFILEVHSPLGLLPQFFLLEPLSGKFLL